MDWIWSGKVWAFGDDIANDEGLMPLRLTRAQEYDPKILSRHCFEQIDPDFAKNAKPHDFVVAGRNFGYGNPHIQGFLGLKGLELGLIVESMSRGPLRACVNAGVPVLRVPEVTKFARTGDLLTVDFLSGVLINNTTKAELRTPPLPEVMREIVAAGGGIGYMKKKLAVEAPRPA
jgi:3-isopropylmalate/(R)-2-methylmalate dehydratase small subunit